MRWTYQIDRKNKSTTLFRSAKNVLRHAYGPNSFKMRIFPGMCTECDALRGAVFFFANNLTERSRYPKNAQRITHFDGADFRE